MRNAFLVLAVFILAVWSIYPPDKKLRLGKDLRGGFNVVYQVDLGTDVQNREETLDKVIQVVKDRLDPNGLLDISIIKSGADRIEITMPLPGEESKKLRAEYEAEIGKLVTTAVDRTNLDRVVALPAADREREFERMSGGAPERLERFRATATAYEQWRAANATYNAATTEIERLRAELEEARAKKDQVGEEYIKLLEQGLRGKEELAFPVSDAANAAEDAYHAAADTALSSIISRDEVEHALNRRAADIRVANPDDPSKPLTLPSARAVAIENLAKRHPEAAEQIKKVAAAWANAEANVKINDPNDLIRLLEGSGVLNFRISVNPNELGAQEMELRDQLQRLGPQNARTDQARWFKVNKIENWIKSKDDYDALKADPAAYFARRQAVIGEEFDGDYYILCWDKKGFRLTERDGSAWQLAYARPDVDSIGRRCIAFGMDAVGSDLLGELTGNNVGRQMAVILDDEVYTAPSINSKISSSGVIEGNFSEAEIQYITRVLSHGSLAAKLSKKPISQDIIAPDKGVDNLRRGLMSAFVAFAVCSGFMIVYYFACGIISVFGLFFNAVLVVASMALLDAPFTLPGIAGMVLVFGQAIDANVLIYERMREEMHRGHDLKTSIRLGYDKAFSAIVDGNVTTFIICIVLGFTGTQEIKGFGITLGIGNVMTLFTQLFVTRLIFAWLVDHTGWWKKARMLPLVFPGIDRALALKVDWMRYRWPFTGFSVILTIICIGLIAYRGSDMLDSQFRGGTKVAVKLKETTPGGARVKKTHDEVQQLIADAAAADPSDLALESLKHSTVVLRNPDPDNASLSSEFQFKTTYADADAVQKGIIRALGPLLDAQPQLRFQGSDSDDPRTAPVYPVVDATLGKNIDRPAAEDKIVDFMGGAVIVLDNIEPPVSLDSIAARLRQFRSQPDFIEAAGRQQEVIRLAGSDEAASAVAILVKDSSIATFEGNDRKWAEKLRDVEWRLARTALTQTTTLASVESFSAEVAATFRAKAIIAFLLSSISVIVYVWVRFGSVRYSMAAIITTLHDCIVAVGAIAFAEIFFNASPGLATSLGILPFKVDLNILAAVLTVLGFSLNDTVIVMDRIREVKGKLPHANRRIINEAINKTISRTVITSGTTLIASVVLYMYGGEAIRGFAFSLTAGVLVASYSGVAVAPTLIWKESHEKHGTSSATGMQKVATA